MCQLSHRYTVEVTGKTARYVGTDEDEAVSALLAIDLDCDEEGYVVAEHTVDGAVIGCPPESSRIENEAIAARVDMDVKWMSAVEAFHGDGPYALANQDPPF
jgi:hypothetical protein